MPRSKPKPRARGSTTFPKGARVAPAPGKLAGADPFIPLVVTDVHKNGRLDVAEQGGGREWTAVRPSDLIPLPN